MGRGLSDLQKTILIVALRNRDGEGRHPEGWHYEGRVRGGGADVTCAEILAEHFGWPMPRWMHQVRDGGPYRVLGGQKFSLAGIGPAPRSGSDVDQVRTVIIVRAELLH